MGEREDEESSLANKKEQSSRESVRALPTKFLKFLWTNFKKHSNKLDCIVQSVMKLNRIMYE